MAHARLAARPPCTRHLLAAAALLCMQSSWAEESLPIAAVVNVAGHYNNAVGTSDAASQGTVTAELIRNRPALRTGELLEFVPGMIVTQHSGDGKANQYFLRGFNLDHGTDFATYVDGMPVNMRTHAHGQGYSDLNFLIPELVQRIDYKKGTYFADEGDFASAGAAHMGLVDRLPQGIASISLGRYDYRRALLADTISAAGGNLTYALDASHNNGPWLLPERARKYNALLRYSNGTQDNGYSVTAMAYRNRWTATDQIPLRAVESGQLDRFGAVDMSDGGEASRYSLSATLRQRSGNSLFEMNAYAMQSALELNSNFSYFLGNPDDGDQFQQAEKRRMAGFAASQTWTSSFNGLDMRNKIGVQSRYDRLAPVGLYNTVERVRTSTVREDRVTESSAALFAENTIEWTPQLRSIVGARVDSYRFKVGSSINGNSGKASDSIVSPKLSLIYAPAKQVELFANYGKGFHSNDARGTTQTRLADGSASSPVTPLVGTRGMELGARTDIIPGLQSSMALWRLDIDSELLFVGDAGDTEPSRASRRSGLEWNNHYIVKPWLLVDLDLAVSRARFKGNDEAGNFIPGSLNKVVAFGVTVNDVGPWFGAFEMRYFGPRPLIEDNSVRSAGTALGTARVGYKLSKSTRVSVDVFNLFNRKASDIDYLYTSRLKGEPAEGVEDIHFHPVEPRSLRVSLTHNF